MREAARHAVVLSLAAGVLCAPGCKAVRTWFNPAEQVELGGAGDPVSTVNKAALSDPQSRRGLEVRLLVVDDTDYDAPRMLRAFESESASLETIDQETRQRWDSWGLRMVQVPIEQLDAALDSLTPVRPVSVQWLGEFATWRALIRAGYSDQSRVRVGESVRTIEPGRARLIARSWAEPMLTPEGGQSVLRLDLGMQIENQSPGEFALLPDQRTRTLDDEGQVIDELLSTITLRGDHAIVIIGEAPGTNWEELPEPKPVEMAAQWGEADDEVGPDESSPSSQLSGQTDAQPGVPRRAERPTEQSSPRPFASGTGQAVGPQPPALRSLGELMLVAQGSRLVRANETRDIPRRVLIVLVPSVRGDYQLLNIPQPRSGT